MPPRSPSSPRWTFAITAAALFMFALDRLVVATALPSIRADLHTTLAGLEWTVNAYTLPFAVLLLTGAALGDRFGRRRMLVAGLGLFTAGSAAAALAPSLEALVAARVLQGLGGALLTPLTPTILVGAVPAERRGRVLGQWAAVAGTAAALGPLVGGAVTDWLSWQWVFALNVPLGLALIPLAHRRLPESHGPHDRLDLPGVALVSGALLAVVWALVRGGASGWDAPEVLLPLAGGLAGLGAFVAWERRAPAPMLPLGLFARRPFAVAAAISVLAYSALFGVLFLVTGLLQTGLGLGALTAGLAPLPWALVPPVVAPIAGAVSDRTGARPVIVAGLALEALAFGWLAAAATAGVAYPWLVPALVLAGVGGACLFAPVQSTALAAVPATDHGPASGATVAVRELAGVLGVAVLAA